MLFLSQMILSHLARLEAHCLSCAPRRKGVAAALSCCCCLDHSSVSSPCFTEFDIAIITIPHSPFCCCVEARLSATVPRTLQFNPSYPHARYDVAHVLQPNGQPGALPS